MRAALKWIGAAVAAVLVAAVVFVLVFDWNDLKGVLSDEATAATGREFRIQGDIDVDLSMTPRIRLDDVVLENASWGRDAPMIEIERIDFRIELWELVQGRVVLPELSLVRPRIVLEKQADGAANWDLGASLGAAAAQEAAVPEDRTEFPIIGELTIENGVVTYIDAAQAEPLTLEIAKGVMRGGDSETPVSIDLDGRYRDRPWRITAEAGSYLTLRDDSSSYPMNVSISLADIQVEADGAIDAPLDLQGIDMSLSLRGNDLADLFPIVGIALPPTPPYSLSGRLRRSGSTWRFSGFEGRVGDSDLRGDAAVEIGGRRPVLTAELVSDRLDFDDLAGFIGATPSVGEGETASPEQQAEAEREAADDRVLPDTPIDLVRLRAMDAEVTLEAKRIEAPDLPLDRLDVELSLENGVLRLSPAAFNVGSGDILLYLSLYGDQDVPVIDLDLRVKGLDLKQVLRETGFAEDTFGPIGGRAKLKAAGRSTREALGNADGDVILVMSGGRVSHLLIELVGLDIFQSLGFLVSEDEPVTVRCAVADFKATNGVFGAEALVFDTTDTKILGEGEIDLRREVIDVRLIPNPKDTSALSLKAPIRIEGRLSDPRIYPDPAGLESGGEVSKAIGIALTPILGLIPFVDLGLGEDSDCKALFEQSAE